MMVSQGINAASWSLRVTRADTQRALRAQGYTCWKEVRHFYLYCKGSKKMRTVLGNNVERVKGSVVRDSKFSEHLAGPLGGNSWSGAHPVILTMTHVDSNPSSTIFRLPVGSPQASPTCEGEICQRLFKQAHFHDWASK